MTVTPVAAIVVVLIATICLVALQVVVLRNISIGRTLNASERARQQAERSLAHMQADLRTKDAELAKERNWRTSIETAMRQANGEIDRLKKLLGIKTTVDDYEKALRERADPLLRAKSLDEKAQLLAWREAELRKKEAALVARQVKLNTEIQTAAKQEEALATRRTSIDTSARMLREDLDKLQNELVAMDARMGAMMAEERLICDQCWLSWQPSEVNYVPRRTIPIMDRLVTETLGPSEVNTADTRGLTQARARQLIQPSTWQERIRRERPELDTLDKQLEVLFEVRCPSNHSSDAPGRLLEASRNWLMPIVGGTGSGKTVYTTTLIRSLKRSLPDYGYVVQPHDSESANSYGELSRLLFLANKVQPTGTGTQRDMIFRILSSDPNAGSLTLFFNDLPGETWANLSVDQDRTRAGFLLSAKAIMFILDPSQDPELGEIVARRWNRTGSQTYRGGAQPRVLPVPAVSQLRILENIVLFLEKAGGWEKTRIPKHFLLVIAKSDLLKDTFFSADHVVYQTNTHAAPPGMEKTWPLPYDEIRQVSQAVEERLSELVELRHAIAWLKKRFASVTCFAVSSLGYSPDESATDTSDNSMTIDAANLVPTRVADPVLWATYRAGLPSAEQVIQGRDQDAPVSNKRPRPGR